MSWSRTTIARVLLMLGVCVWLVESIGISLHHLAVQHTVCAEHGEMVEIGSGEPTLRASQDPVALISAWTAPAHDHCELVPTAVTTASLRTPGVGLPLPALVEPDPSPPPSVVARAVLPYAPKTSPPPSC